MNGIVKAGVFDNVLRMFKNGCVKPIEQIEINLLNKPNNLFNVRIRI
jgi:hypothetical protein